MINSLYSKPNLNDSWFLKVKFGCYQGDLAEISNRGYSPALLAKMDAGEEQESAKWYTASPYLRMQIGDSLLLFVGGTRLDNQRELAKRLGLPINTQGAELICHAYSSLGDGFESLLLGDFSFALFDERKQILRLIRDPLGICPLYYHFGSNLCIAGNSLERLCGCSEISSSLDEKAVAEWSLSDHFLNQKDTFFRSIKKCPRATVLRIDSYGLQAHEYWSRSEIAPLRYKSEHDYVDHLDDLLKTVIYDRLDEATPLAAHSSGGLDSTPIAMIAGRTKIKLGQAFHTFNWCKPDIGDDVACDEWENARKVAVAEGFEHHEIGARAESLKHILLHHNIALDGTTTFEYEHDLLLRAQEYGIKRIYSGFGGDEFLSPSFRDRHLDAIRAGRFLHVFKRLIMETDPRQDLRWLRLSAAYVRRIYNSLLPKKTLYRNLFEINRARFLANSELLTKEFTQFAATQYQDQNNDFLTVDTISELQGNFLVSGYHQERMECWATLGGRVGIHYVYPYLDKRIVEFALAIPSELYFKCGRSRYLYLQAVGKMLPEHLLKETKSAEIYRVRQLIREFLRVLSDPDIQDMISSSASPYVDTKSLLEKCRKAHNLNSATLKNQVIQVRAMITAILTLNLHFNS